MFRTLPLVLVLVFASGCAQHAPPSLEGQITQAGRRVIAAGESVLSGVDQLVTNGTLSKAEATRVVTIIQRVGVEGERLSVIMTEVDASKDAVARAQGLHRAAEILKIVQNLVTTAASEISADPARAELFKLLSQITSVVIEVAMLLPTST